MAMNRANGASAPRRITILGSTGSVGTSTIDLIERNPGAFEIEALTANKNVKLLAEQARRLKPQLAVVADPSLYSALKQALADTNIAVAAGPEALVEAAKRPASWVMSAIVGAAGLKATLAAVERGACVALANKESLVCAGDLMTEAVKRFGATLLPVDSEHNAIFQCFESDQRRSIERLILTASGGPFRTRKREELRAVTPAQAVAHPNWDMGAKISVDSATMMNKGLEVIEACHLFAMPEAQIDVVVHPQSIIHSMVAYEDGSVLAQLGSPDMRTPIAYTLAWPHRMAAPSARLDFAKIATLTFEPPDPLRFPALRLARQALKDGGTAPTVLNAANEVAVYGFLEGRVGFLEITDVVEETLAAMPAVPMTSLEQLSAVDAEARSIAARRAKVVGRRA
ncbi:MAG: 1-deoxy-D-xylulose-5-phosphate reductoisomerase [Alphaproteobacteria bacterium]|nr:1-deoxy-D-xylulose-5-phosphate reductoisomerase [Alphaproteobacteria bacterium]